RLLRPLYQQGVNVLAERGGSWKPADLPHLATALYLLIFGYFASAALFEAVTQQDPRSQVAVHRQRQFLKAALAKLFASDDPRAEGRCPSPRSLPWHRMPFASSPPTATCSSPPPAWPSTRRPASGIVSGRSSSSRTAANGCATTVTSARAVAWHWWVRAG